MSHPRALLGFAAALLASSLWLPLWYTHMEAPQYRGEEALEVVVYAGEVKGDLTELSHLNQYIGVKMDLDIPELHASPYILGGLLALSLVLISLPRCRLHLGALVLATCMALCVIGGFVTLHERLYALGHERGDSPFARVEDFTPPLLGTQKIANFTVTTGLGAGAWAYALAFFLAAGVAWRGETSSGPTQDSSSR